jgi:hypothetical protein
MKMHRIIRTYETSKTCNHDAKVQKSIMPILGLNIVQKTIMPAFKIANFSSRTA